MVETGDPIAAASANMVAAANRSRTAHTPARVGAPEHNRIASVVSNLQVTVEAPQTPTLEGLFAANPNLVLERNPKQYSRDVLEFQKIIGVKADGYFGDGTLAAMRTYQAKYGLPQTDRMTAADIKPQVIAGVSQAPRTLAPGIVQYADGSVTFGGSRHAQLQEGVDQWMSRPALPSARGMNVAVEGPMRMDVPPQRYAHADVSRANLVTPAPAPKAAAARARNNEEGRGQG